MEYLIGSILAVGCVALGFVLGWTFQPVRKPVENGLGSAVILLKQVADKSINECAETRKFASDIVDRLMTSNQNLADKVLVVVDGTLERLRIEQPIDPMPTNRTTWASPAPRVEEADITIPDRSRPDEHD